MKPTRAGRHHNPNPAGASRPASSAVHNGNGNGFTPSADDVARRAYFCYENAGSQGGHDVQHWLAAEAQLIAEHAVT